MNHFKGKFNKEAENHVLKLKSEEVKSSPLFRIRVWQIWSPYFQDITQFVGLRIFQFKFTATLQRMCKFHSSVHLCMLLNTLYRENSEEKI